MCFDCNVELTHKMDPLYTNKLSDAILMETEIETNYFHCNGSSKIYTDNSIKAGILFLSFHVLQL